LKVQFQKLKVFLSERKGMLCETVNIGTL